MFFTVTDVNATSTPGYTEQTSPRPSADEVRVTTSTSRSSSSISTDDAVQVVHVETGRRVLGPVVVVTSSESTVKRRFNVDVLLRHSSYNSSVMPRFHVQLLHAALAGT